MIAVVVLCVPGAFAIGCWLGWRLRRDDQEYTQLLVQGLRFKQEQTFQSETARKTLEQQTYDRGYTAGFHDGFDRALGRAG